MQCFGVLARFGPLWSTHTTWGHRGGHRGSFNFTTTFTSCTCSTGPGWQSLNRWEKVMLTTTWSSQVCQGGHLFGPCPMKPVRKEVPPTRCGPPVGVISPLLFAFVGWLETHPIYIILYRSGVVTNLTKPNVWTYLQLTSYPINQALVLVLANHPNFYPVTACLLVIGDRPHLVP